MAEDVDLRKQQTHMLNYLCSDIVTCERDIERLSAEHEFARRSLSQAHKRFREALRAFGASQTFGGFEFHADKADRDGEGDG